jgi:hypothetical protein
MVNYCKQHFISHIPAFLSNIISDEIKEDELGGACSMYGHEMHTFWSGNLGIDGTIILRCTEVFW